MNPTESTSNSDRARLEEALNIATEAYIYGYPLVTMDMTRKQMTNVAIPDEGHAPMGQLVKMRDYPTADLGDRYYLLPILEGWTNVFQVPGKRTTGGKPQKYAITGPGWSGQIPSGVTEYKSPTGLAWLIGRIYCTGTPDDYKAVHTLQDNFELVPLRSYGKAYRPVAGEVKSNVDMKTAVRDQVDGLGVDEYFSYLARLMKTNPPAAEDTPMVAKMAKIGLVPGQDFDGSKLRAFDNEAIIEAVPKTAQLKIMEHFKHAGRPVNGWMVTTHAGTYGTDYMQRAFVTAIGLGANRPQDAIYPTGERDADGKEFDGASNKYVMHFDKGQMPPVDGFWSLTMYDKSYFFVPNPLNRFTLSQRNKFVTNPDGSVDLHLQADSPDKAKEANWLPAPKAKFVAMLRLYWPKETPPSIIDGTWKPPAIRDQSSTNQSRELDSAA